MAGDTSSHKQAGEGWGHGPGGRDGAGAVDGCFKARGTGASDSDISLSLPARPENVALIRQVLGALADELALPRDVVEDMRLAVTEACTNVVRHAYGDGSGTIELTLRPSDDVFEVIVADAGRGSDASTDASGPGLGLPLIAALADTLRVDRSRASGSRVLMSFRRDRSTTGIA